MPVSDLPVPVLRPTAEDVLGGCSWEAYIQRHENKIAKTGIAKIVWPSSLPPPRRSGYGNLGHMLVPRSIRQHAVGSKGQYRMVLVENPSMTLDEFKRIAEENGPNQKVASGQEARAGTQGEEGLERKFWQNVTLSAPLYGADVEGSLFDQGLKGWNLRRLDTLLSTVLEEAGHKLPGVNTPYLYFGQWRSVFAWHTEDADLYSVNYLHCGAPKQWYVIPPEARDRFETVVHSQLPALHKECHEFLRHKELLLSPQFLDQHNIPYVKAVQREREFVITYPGAYHAGFNHGFNIAESVNFATKRWIPIGARAGHCTCAKDTVKIDMRLFRHLVPASQLPDDIWIDTSDEESSEDSDASSSGDDSASGSEDSTTESLHHASHTTGRKRGRAQRSGRDPAAGSPPTTAGRGRGGKGGPKGTAAPARKRARRSTSPGAERRGATSRRAAGPTSRHATQHEEPDSPVAPSRRPARRLHGGMLTRSAAAGRLSVRERLAMRGVVPGAAPAARRNGSSGGGAVPPARAKPSRAATPSRTAAPAATITADPAALPSAPAPAPPVPATQPAASLAVEHAEEASHDSGATQAGVHPEVEAAGAVEAPAPAPARALAPRAEHEPADAHDDDSGGEGAGRDADAGPSSSPAMSTRPRRATAGQPPAALAAAFSTRVGGDGEGTGGSQLPHKGSGGTSLSGVMAALRTGAQKAAAVAASVLPHQGSKPPSAPLGLHSTRGRQVRMTWKLLGADE